MKRSIATNPRRNRLAFRCVRAPKIRRLKRLPSTAPKATAPTAISPTPTISTATAFPTIKTIAQPSSTRFAQSTSKVASPNKPMPMAMVSAMLATHIRSAPQTIHLADNFLVRRYGYAIRRRLRLFAALDERNKYGFAKRLLHGVQYGAFF